MKPGIRKLINFLFIGVTIALVCILAFGNSDLENAWEALFTLDPWWLLGAAGCWFAYLFFDALGYHYFLRKQGYGVKLSFAASTIATSPPAPAADSPCRSIT